MVNAQIWLDKNYPRNGTCIREDDKENYDKTREEIENLNIVDQKLEGDLDLSAFPNLIKLELEAENQLNIKFPSHEVKVLAISTDSKSDVLKTQFQELNKKITYLEQRVDELIGFVKETRENIVKRFGELGSLPKEVFGLLGKLIGISEESTTFIVKERENRSLDYGEKLWNYEEEIWKIKNEIKTKIDKETMRKILIINNDTRKSMEAQLELESKRKEKEELFEQLKEVQSQIQITPK